MISIENLCKSYPKVELYQNFDLEVQDGEICCVLGESGSGKTTLLNVVANLTDYSGEVKSGKCGYIFQSPRLVPNLTVEKNLRLVCKDDKKIAEMLEKVRLSDKTEEYPAHLSGGQAQRVAIARAFLYGANVILMDEPFSSLDLKLKREMCELFFSVWEESKPSVLFVTHDVDEAISVSDRILVISRGKVVFDFRHTQKPPRGDDPTLRKKLVDALINCN